MDPLVLDMNIESNIELSKLVIEKVIKKKVVIEWVVKSDPWILELAQVKE